MSFSLGPGECRMRHPPGPSYNENVPDRRSSVARCGAAKAAFNCEGYMSLGVIFDMDGVLVASGPAHAASWRVVADQHGIEITDETFSRLFGRPSRDIVRIIWGDGVSDETIAKLDDEKEAAYRAIIAGAVPLMEGCRELLSTLERAGFTMAVGTSGPPENVALVLNETGIGRFFSATVHGFDIQRGKPAPDCFLLAAQRCGLASGACVVVEDAPVGIQSAVAAGMRSIGLVGTHPAGPLTDAGASRIVEDLAEITPSMITDLLQTP